MRWSRSKGKWIGSYSCSATPLTSKGNKGTRGNALWGKQLPEISFEPLRNKQPLNWMQLKRYVSLWSRIRARSLDSRLWTRKNNRRRANSAEMQNPSAVHLLYFPARQVNYSLQIMLGARSCLIRGILDYFAISVNSVLLFSAIRVKLFRFFTDLNSDFDVIFYLIHCQILGKLWKQIRWRILFLSMHPKEIKLLSNQRILVARDL